MGPRGRRLTYPGVQPPPSEPASMPSSLGDAAHGDEDNPNSEAEGSNMPKKVRGKSCGKNILKAIAKNGGRKLQILIPNHLARPVENASLLATGIGIIIRRHAPVMNIKTYDDIPSQDKTQLRGALMAWFEFIDIETDPLVQDKLDDMLRTAFRRWKNTMHVAYNESKDAGHNPIDDCPYDWFEGGVWKAMCDSFEEPSFKRRSEKNKDNRSKLPYPHSSGTQSFHVRYYRMGTSPGMRKSLASGSQSYIIIDSLVRCFVTVPIGKSSKKKRKSTKSFEARRKGNLLLIFYTGLSATYHHILF